jgi:hypothetical protein
MKRRVIGRTVLVARLIGLALIVLGALSLVEMRFLTSHSARNLGLISGLALALVGIVWLGVVQVFLRFFDQFLSRN